ncbi:guanine deaminase protein [Rutstroemia sp. NJR-2017a BVV2]|nr:guanine deaminase protein [Rutstroemia sp. NJR-2017a BVV2]
MPNATLNAPLLFYGSIIHSISLNVVEYAEQGMLIVQSGKILFYQSKVARDEIFIILARLNLQAFLPNIRYLKKGQFIIPGFVDTHNHAPQWAQRGLGRGLEILDWLDQVTFPNEARFEDPVYARKVYSSCVDGFIKQGITTASYYGSLHGEATKILADICLDKGQRAFVGKCNMDRNSPPYYTDASAESSLEVTKDFISHVRKIDQDFSLVSPVLTPRFAITCSPKLLTGLGQIASENPELPIQTHFCEAESEKSATLSLFPNFKNEADLYESFKLLSERSILAHCTIMTDYEIERLATLKCGVAHCPISNTTVGGGFMAAPIREFLRRGIKVGLGTDSGGGFSSSILDAMRQAFIVSNAKHFLTGGADPRLSLAECFYLATLGGAQVCCLDKQIGNFEVGKQFDALLIDTHKNGAMTVVEDKDTLEVLFEKFLMSGDDRNIVDVYVRGRQIKH